MKIGFGIASEEELFVLFGGYNYSFFWEKQMLHNYTTV